MARLSLLVEVETLRGIVAQGAGRSIPEAAGPASSPILEASDSVAEPIIGGRITEFSIDDLLAAFAPAADETERLFTPREMRERLGCSESSGGRLLQAACAAGLVEKATRGAYRVRAG